MEELRFVEAGDLGEDLLGQFPEADQGAEFDLIGDAQAAFRRFHVGERREAAERFAGQKAVAEGVRVEADRRRPFEDGGGDATVLVLDARVAVEAPRVVRFVEVDRKFLCLGEGFEGLFPGDDQLAMDEVAPVGADLAGDRVDLEIFLLRGVEQRLKPVGHLDGMERGEGDTDDGGGISGVGAGVRHGDRFRGQGAFF